MLQTSVNIPIINILEETVSAAISRYDGAGKIGILATEGTVKSNSYQMVCRRHGIEPAVPGGADQAALMSVIYDQVKSGGDADIGVLTHIAGSLVAEGCGAVIFGCTELSIVYNASPGRFRELPIVDSMDVLADVAIGMMGKSLK
jgi:aspartate racemase